MTDEIRISAHAGVGEVGNWHAVWQHPTRLIEEPWQTRGAAVVDAISGIMDAADQAGTEYDQLVVYISLSPDDGQAGFVLPPALITRMAAARVALSIDALV